MNLNEKNIEESIFNYLEGNLSGSELEDFKSFINSNPEAKAELGLWKQTYVRTNVSTVSSVEFSSLKKSNKIYYWASSVVAAFLLGIGTMAVYNNNTMKLPQNQIEVEKVQITIPQESISEKISEPIIEEKIINEVPIETSKNETINEVTESVEEEVLQENIKMSEQLDVNIEPSETNREAKLNQIKIKKETVAKKKKEVDVIDLETGF